MAAKLKADKWLVRKEITKLLRSLSRSDIQSQSEQVISRLVKTSYFQHSKNISCYLSMPNAELDTSSLISTILRSGKTLFVPRLDPENQGKMDFLRVHGEDDLASFPTGLWGIREPSPQWQGQKRQSALDKDSEGLDLILLPAVAFDQSLARLGHGKGYYDRFISSYKSAFGHPPLLVGLALRQQILESGRVPTDELDWAMDAIIGPDGVLQREEDPHLM